MEPVKSIDRTEEFLFTGPVLKKEIKKNNFCLDLLRFYPVSLHLLQEPENKKEKIRTSYGKYVYDKYLPMDLKFKSREMRLKTRNERPHGKIDLSDPYYGKVIRFKHGVLHHDYVPAYCYYCTWFELEIMIVNGQATSMEIGLHDGIPLVKLLDVSVKKVSEDEYSSKYCFSENKAYLDEKHNLVIRGVKNLDEEPKEERLERNDLNDLLSRFSSLKLQEKK